MKFKIIGSGGCVALPKPLCKCEICKEARLKGNPYSRFGCSLFLEDLNLLVDTPEDITQAINYSDIDEIKYVLYSHVDPDHTLGMRVFEHIRLNWLEISKGKECCNPVNVLAMNHVMEDINSIKFKLGSYLDYYENVRNLIKRNIIESHISIDEVKISFFKVNHSTVFVFEKNNKKVIYAPCDVKPFPNESIFEDADLLIIGNTVVGDKLKDGFVLNEDNPLRKELFTLSEIQGLKNKYNINQVIITHLEEDWGKSYDDYIELEKYYKDIRFAYDGMEIEI
ncbi:metallo-hydrolase/oxidoreductase [Paraclostridium ghonii]|uniref:Phosphoribosyl 1,2-cyclic phosphate phosphodiesterase n=1 Tax=Paraclostridium ghonii TaxID=29358 RepID=A0ABU0MZ68_9FIRM|nr:MBL fold metallo-hydrolase [Paeniclostridium ghonii]MDQ0555756.1 phosphoribosyl 1,2-cyclic phosphate phosphodiesterase [Paeniclostridium ghonii]